jgi:uncharacterized LabA/DUF88 family protein
MLRAAVFIDNGYFSKVLKNHFSKPNIDYKLFSNNVCGEYDRLRTCVYDCMPYKSDPPTPDEREYYGDKHRFKTALEKLPRFEIRLGELQKIKCAFKQKMVDVLLSVDLVHLSWSHQIQTAILVVGDRDYVPAVKSAKEAGVLIQLYYKLPVHNQLLKECDETIEISKELIRNSLKK